MNIINIFIIILFICSNNKINCACVPEKEASKASECLRETNQDTYCCFITPLEDPSGKKMCYPYAKNKYFGYLNINHNKRIYEIDCGLGSTFMDSNWNMTLEDRGICGSPDPNSYKDCQKDSTSDNSCCFYEGEDLKGCYWLGIQYTGKVSTDEYTFICGSLYIKYYKMLLFFIFLFFV